MGDRHGSTPFALRLKQLRVLRGFRTARAFAQALEIDENRYTRWERGEVEPSVAMLGKMADILDLPVDVLVSGGDVAAALPATLAMRETGAGGARHAAPLGWSDAPGMQEEPAAFGAENSQQDLGQKVLITSRAYLMSLIERRVAGMSQSEIDALIGKLTSLPPGATLEGLD